MTFFRYHAKVLVTVDYNEIEIGFGLEKNKRDAREMACRSALLELHSKDHV